METRTIVILIIRFFSTMLTVFFLSIIFLPLIDQTFELDLDKKENTENRVLTARPDFSIDSVASFPRRYEGYFSDNFSFRNLLVNLNSTFTTKAYEISAIPDVLIGKEGWLYFVSKNQGNSREDFMGRLRMSQPDLDSIQSKLECRTRELQTKGIRFLVAVAPDKHSIYPDFLPDQTERKGRYPSRLDQIVRYLDRKSSVKILDLRTTLIEKRDNASFPLFKKTDSHWNYFGAFIAYTEIMKSLQMIPKKESDFQWTQITNPMGGDLAGMLAASNQFKEENEMMVSPLFKSELTFAEVENNYGTGYKGKPMVATNKDRSLPKLLIFHDSFGGALQQFLSYHFRESVFIGSHYSSVIVKREKPDVVIVLTVERYVDQILPLGEL